MGKTTRLRDAYRRVGMRGFVNDLRWRYRTASGERSILDSTRAAVRLGRAEGWGAVRARMRRGAGQFSTPDAVIVEPPQPPPHPWTITFAHDAAFNPFFALNAEELVANREVTKAFAKRPAEVRTATWFLTYFNHAFFGGVHTILRLMNWMTQEHAVRHRLVVFDRLDATDNEIRSAVTAAFPALESIDIVLPVEGRLRYEELPHTDIAVCTMWISAYAMARFNDTAAKFYMVQDFEPAFYPAGTLSALAEATYRLGFAGIVNTPGLDDAYRQYGNPSIAFVPAVDPVAVTEKPSTKADEPVQIVLYGRPSTDRNAFELIAAASVELKRQHGDAIRIVSAGEEWDPADLGLEGVVENLGLLPTLDDVKSLYAASDIGVCFMVSKHPSYQPFEYLAAGVAPVVNRNAATAWMLEDGKNCLVTEPFTSSIAEAVSRLVDDGGLRRSIADHGREQVTATVWDEELGRVWEFISGTDGE